MALVMIATALPFIDIGRMTQSFFVGVKFRIVEDKTVKATKVTLW